MDLLMSIMELAGFLVLVFAVIGSLAVTHGSESRTGFGDDAGRRPTRGDWT